MDRVLTSSYKIYSHQKPIERLNYAHHIVYNLYYYCICICRYVCEYAQNDCVIS